MQTDIDAMDSEHLAAINKQESAINQTVNEISQIILEMRRLSNNNDVYLVSKYQSRNHEFKVLPTQIQVTLPRFIPTRNNREQISKQIGSLSKLEITWRPISKAFLDKPRILANVNTRVNERKILKSVSCLIDTEFWTYQTDNMIRLFNLQGEIVKSIKGKSRSITKFIAVTQSGDLAYVDGWPGPGSVHLIRGSKIKTLINLPDWDAVNLCSTSSGDFLVIMKKDMQYKVVRYFGSKVKQKIQRDDHGKPLYKSGSCLTENRNLDIWVADFEAGATVVVNAAGQLRFKYIGPLHSTYNSSSPSSITSDSRANILMAYSYSHSIHIVDQDGNFLRYIDNCDSPTSLSIDTSDNLFIAEEQQIVKKIQYYK